MMQPESQVILREFSRRLRAALHEAPNHIRVEAALEVESHVLDVLSRSGGTEPEPELVARVLHGFGPPEAYARAILNQIPGEESVTISGGLREVGQALADLFRGAWRLLRALIGRGSALLVTALSILWHAALAFVRSLRAPAAKTSRWLRINGIALAYWLRRTGRRVGNTLMDWGGAALKAADRGVQGAGALAQGTGVIVQRLGRGLVSLFDLAVRLLRWTLRAAGVAAMALIGLLSLGVAAFAAWAPDVTGWIVRGIQLSTQEQLDDLRRRTIGWRELGPRGELVDVGIAVFEVTLALGLVMFALLIYLGWNARRRRRAAATGH